MAEGKRFYFVCPKCGEHVTTRVPDLNNVEVECKRCHEKFSWDGNNIFVRSHNIADTYAPIRYIGEIMDRYDGEFPMLLLPPPMRLFCDIARKHKLELRYIKIDDVCEIYALKQDHPVIKMYYSPGDAGYDAVKKKIKLSMLKNKTDRTDVFVESSETNEEYLLKINTILIGISKGRPTDYILYFILDDENKCAVRITGWKEIWDEMKDIIHDFEMGGYLVDKMDIGY